MKKIFFIVLGVIVGFSTKSFSQDNSITQDFLLDKNAVQELPTDEEAIANAQNAARRLLKQRPQTLRKQSFPTLRSKVHTSEKKVSSNNTLAPNAPFGLAWGASIEDTKRQGIELDKVLIKDHPNSFSASNLPKEVADISRVDISFGEENQLWRILAYGKLLDDDANASKVLKMYTNYASLLERKYGNKKQFFTPAIIDIIQKDERGKDITVQKEAPIGNKEFLSQLQSGQAVLYSTYQNKEVGAALAVNVDGEGKSYIVIDYKNLTILEKQEQQTLDAL